MQKPAKAFEYEISGVANSVFSMYFFLAEHFHP